MASLPILLYPHPVLRIPTVPIVGKTLLESGGERGVELVKQMLRTMKLSRGVGLSAPQIGLSSSFFVMQVKRPRVIINPRVVHSSVATTTAPESCLSIPDCAVTISSPSFLVVEYFDFDYFTGGLIGPMQEEFHSLEARVVAHEMDHLRGKLIVDYLVDGLRSFE